VSGASEHNDIWLGYWASKQIPSVTQPPARAQPSRILRSTFNLDNLSLVSQSIYLGNTKLDK